LPSLPPEQFFAGTEWRRYSPRKKMGLTFAPEAGSDRMRRVINKQLTEQENSWTPLPRSFGKAGLSIKAVFHGGDCPTETKRKISKLSGSLVDKNPRTGAQNIR